MRVADHASMWHNPRHLAEIIVHYHWVAISDVPFPHEHWAPRAELLTIATATINNSPVVRQWAIDMAAETRHTSLQDLAGGTGGPPGWRMPRRRYDERGRLLPLTQPQQQTWVAQQQVAELPARNIAARLGPKSVPKDPPLHPQHQQRQSSASSSRGASSSTDTAYDRARQRQNDPDNQ